MKSGTDHVLLPVYGVIGLIALWYLAVWVQVVDPVLLPSPQEAARTSACTAPASS